MAAAAPERRKQHNLLLVEKLFEQRAGVSPFTLVLDSTQQSGRPLVRLVLARAKAAGIRTVYLSFGSTDRPKNVDFFLPAGEWLWGQDEFIDPNQHTLIACDSLNELANFEEERLINRLQNFIGEHSSLLGMFDVDEPTVGSTTNPYAPSPVTQLKTIATTTFHVRSFHDVLAEKQAQNRSQADPFFGLYENIDGILQGLNSQRLDGMILEMDYKRRGSGRSLKERYYVVTKRGGISHEAHGVVSLLEQHPLFAPQTPYQAEEDEREIEKNREESTFELDITERQRAARQGVVLPYHDAQRGGGDGGRILYDMGVEDDFDPEEDEI
ncbi:uncharacterized protein LTR77_010598 [Saxophila tyrrhenica]|uniref:Elongator complex protein 5 n=1 Tax=Saxophila tyrrhenica TaxID=1690608 RepID=A0AAV9NVP3_9PEZI|nr:hypothetical protein LTR77_010598 [Saxophila tyrrhenica]